MDSELAWLRELADAAGGLPTAERPAPYWSQRHSTSGSESFKSQGTTARRVRQLIGEMHDDHFFAEALGFDCVDGNGDSEATPEIELDRRVGKPHLWRGDPTGWDEDDLCDFVEVFHDLAARPTDGWFHSFSGCGWHPSKFNRRSGQAIYRWRINETLETSVLDVRLAEVGEDAGRMVRVAPGALEQLVGSALSDTTSARDEVAHAVALFRARSSSRQQRRSAVVALARLLEDRRSLLKEELLSKDEGALFLIANRFDLRHKGADQHVDYAEEFLEWIFYWYLATVRLAESLIARQDDEPT